MGKKEGSRDPTPLGGGDSILSRATGVGSPTHPRGSSSHAIVYIAEYVRYLCIWSELCIGFNPYKVTDCPNFNYLFTNTMS